MRKELEIIKHLIELYTGDISDEAMVNYELKNSEQVKMYAEAFSEYDLSDVLKAIDEYWNFKNSTTKPTVAKILAMLNSNREVKKDQFANIIFNDKALDDPKDWRTFWNIDPALAYYLRDCATMSSEKVHALLFYRRALADIIALKVNTLPNAGKMNYAEKVAIVRRNGWDADITEKAGEMALEAKGQNPESVKQALNALASHWRIGA